MWSDRFLLLYAIEVGPSTSGNVAGEFACNRLEDLTLFEQTERWLSQEDFVRTASQRIFEGMLLFTAVKEGVLAHFGWLVPHQRESTFPYVGQRYEYPQGTAVLFNAYTHPKARRTGLHERSVRQRVYAASQVPGVRRVMTAIESHNATSRAVMERVGFRCVDVLYERIRLGQIARGRLRPDVYFAERSTK